MQPIAHLVKVTVPDYLANLPIPDSIGGWFKLGFKDWLALVPPTALAAGVGYTLYRAYCPKSQCKRSGRVNNVVQLSNPKVVDSIDVEDISEKAAFCRCWKSKNWPYCDGTHATHNKETGDNLGPVIVKKNK
ncbi:CDGSH iron-sulfur domain-containing protein 2 homolog [Anthonomus grandis grandis]|uniref:CDGSH iron-sulfur domain-containing protein 2 homolog n=1 Tax=Anthonomus grandis grandis TaxID=2921223 RepID=UPI002164F515|nr:CDGSH iron-sulfur domain-containing protein 2 homolog [Anthonomus grandis grandis]